MGAFNSNSQDKILPKVVPNTPNSAELGKFGSVPVGLFTGTVQTNIPLFELSTNNLSVPVTLNYSSNGLRVDKVSSWVGYDWSLDAGGVITRNIKGNPDDIKSLIQYPNGLESDMKNLYNFVKSTSGNADVENDEYSYNFLGQSGKFVFDAQGNAIPIPFAKMKITKASNYSSITIQTQDGTKYIFSAVETTQIYDSNNIGSVYVPTSWYLKQIVHHTGEVINFYYSNQYWVQYYSGVNQTISSYITFSSGSCPFDASSIENDYLPKVNITNSWSLHLDSIVAPGFGKVIFESAKNRKDFIDDYKLDRVKLLNSKKEIIKSVEFYYSFPQNLYLFPAQVSLTQITGSIIINGTTYNHADEVKYRMFLDSIGIMSKSNLKIQKYKFNYYNKGELPSRLSFSQDHWGYFNGKNNNCFTPTNINGISTYPSLVQKIASLNLNCSKEPDAAYSKKGMLQSIVYPTTGYSVIEYEANFGNGVQSGGCRVLRTLTYEKQGAIPETKRYYYSSGHVYSNFGYLRYYNITNNCVTGSQGQQSSDNEQFITLISGSLYSLFSGSYHICYPEVKISNGENYENGGESHIFMSARDVVGTNPAPSFCDLIVPSPQSNYGWKAGTKVSESYFKKNANGSFVTLKTVNNTYNENENRNYSNIQCLGIIYSRTQPNGYIVTPENEYTVYLKCYDLVKYNIFSHWMPLIARTTITYDQNGLNPVEQKEIFQYDNPIHILPTKKIIIKSNGDSLKTRIKYPEDYSSGVNATIDLMKGSKYIVNQPVEEQTWINNSGIVSGKVTEFGQFGAPSIIKPYKIYTLETNTLNKFGQTFSFNGPFSSLLPTGMNYQLKATLESYDSKGNLLKASKKDDVKLEYIWGYNQAYPILSSENCENLMAAYNSALTASGLSSLDEITIPSIDSNQKTKLKNFTTALYNNYYAKSANINVYTYLPLVGITSQTEPNGVTSYYEYDDFGRLKCIKNDDGQILKTFEYNYKQ